MGAVRTYENLVHEAVQDISQQTSTHHRLREKTESLDRVKTASKSNLIFFNVMPC